MRRRLLICSVVLGMAMSLCGCGLMPEIPELTEEQTNLITEYSAGLILKHQSVNYGLLSEEELAEAERMEAEAKAREEKNKQLAQEYLERTEAARKEKEEKKKSKKDKDTTDVEEVAPIGPAEISNGKLAEFCGIDGFDVSYAGYDLVDSYPGDGSDNMFAIGAPDDKKLCVVKLNVSNTSGQDADFSMFDRKSSFKLNVNGSESYNNDTTLLMDDFSMYKGTIEAGKATQMILVFEIDGGTDISTLSMEVGAGSSSGVMYFN